MNSPYDCDEQFTSLRRMVLELQAADLDPLPGTGVLAVVMETGYPDAVASLVTVADGSTSLYFSNGGGVVGAGEHARVRTAAKRFLEASASYVDGASTLPTSPLPAPGRVCFHFVTSDGPRSFERDEEELGYDRSELSPLFYKGHEVLAALRESSGG